MQKKYLILFLILSFIFIGSFTNAQVQNTDIVLTISPQNPSPNQNVNATLNSHVTNLDKANISWLINNQEENVGIGKKTFSLKVGDLGIPIVLTAIIDTIDGQSVSKTIVIFSTDIDILWQASDAYTHPFYKGKALAPSQGKFKMVAIPSLLTQGEKINANNLSYIWIKDGNVQTNSSGWGKSSYIFQNSYLDKGNTVEVKISDITGNINASKNINLKTIEPKIVFYENNPSLGTKWENSINDGFSISKNGATIVAEPYFFSPKDINSSNLSLDWYINENKIPTQLTKNILPIVPEEGKSGNAVIKLIVNNTKTLFQSAEKKLNVQF